MIIKYFIHIESKIIEPIASLVVLVSLSLSDGVEPLPVTNSSIVWFKLKSTFFNTSKDIFMCFLHIPPENSSYTVKNGDDFDTLINDICKYSSSGDLMLCGDFNARTASDPDFIQYDSNDKFIQNDSNYIYDLVNFCRISTDVTTCNRGIEIMFPKSIENS